MDNEDFRIVKRDPGNVLQGFGRRMEADWSVRVWRLIL